GLLFSFLNPAHELRVEEILQEELDGSVAISLSHRVAREWREYERTSSAVLEAYTAPVIRRYLERLQSEMTTQGLSVPLHVMQSSGGVVTADSARERPLQTLMSGPVGGTMGLVALARMLDRPNLIGVDMGGTSFDVSLVVGGRPSRRARERGRRSRPGLLRPGRNAPHRHRREPRARSHRPRHLRRGPHVAR